MTTKAILNKRHAEACDINILLDKMCKRNVTERHGSLTKNSLNYFILILSLFFFTDYKRVKLLLSGIIYEK